MIFRLENYYIATLSVMALFVLVSLVVVRDTASGENSSLPGVVVGVLQGFLFLGRFGTLVLVFLTFGAFLSVVWIGLMVYLGVLEERFTPRRSLSDDWGDVYFIAGGGL